MEKKGSVARELFSYLVVIAIGILLALILNKWIIINSNVISESMLPTLSKDDKVIGLRAAYWFGDPERGDIVIFRYPEDESQLFVKRIIGLPGDMVIIEDGLIYINGSQVPLEEPYLYSDTVSGNFGPYIIPADCYLVLGDNRDNSDDSRYWRTTSYVTRDEIVAKVILRYYGTDPETGKKGLRFKTFSD